MNYKKTSIIEDFAKDGFAKPPYTIAVCTCSKLLTGKKDNSPNIVFVMMDDLGAEAIGVYGREKSKKKEVN